MDSLAIELNQTLKNTIADVFLSDYGRRMYFPVYGIVEQSAQAGKDAKLYNATTGMAVHNRKPIMVPFIRKQFTELSEAQIVSYANSYGEAELRTLWKSEIYRKNPTLGKALISLPVVVPGLTGGISQAASLFIGEGEKVVCSDLYWENYDMIVDGMRNAELVHFPFYTPDGKFNIDAFCRCIVENASDKRVTVILNFPNNPTGYTLLKKEAEDMKNRILGLACSGYKMNFIIDDAYFGLFYEEDVYSESLFSLFADLHENVMAIKIDGATKEHFVWGFRIGFVTYASKGLNEDHLKALEMKTAGSIRASVSNCSKTAQSILIAALKDGEYESDRKSYDEILEARYRKVKESIEAYKGTRLKALPFNSGYFMCFEVDGNAEKLRQKLLKEFAIGTISVKDKYLRVAFSAVDLDGIEELYAKIFKAAESL